VVTAWRGDFKMMPCPDPPPDALDTDKVYMTIPEVLISWETLNYLGLTEARANELWEQWDSRYIGESSLVTNELGLPEKRCPCNAWLDDFVSFIIRLAQREPDVYMEDDDAQWRTYYDSCGITKDTQDRILDRIQNSEFEDERQSGSSALEFNMELVYWKLALIRTDSYERAAKLQQAASLSGSGSGSQ
jgi:hypothetical protein